MTNDEHQSNVAGAFGSPDASRADVSDRYISVPGTMPDLENIAGRLRERVVIGKKGAGKTFYLRSLQRRMNAEITSDEQDGLKEHDGWVVYRDTQELSTGTVINFSRAINSAHSRLVNLRIHVNQAQRSRNVWTKAWECAFLASIYNLIFRSTDIRSFSECRRHARANHAIKAKFEYAESITDRLPPTPSIIAQMQYFVGMAQDDKLDIRDYFEKSEWSVLHDAINSLAHHTSQVVMFIDAIDEGFDEAPESWLDCQEGLFRAIFSYLNRSDMISNRFHVVTAIREIVFSSLLNSEHASRFLWDEHVHYISWDMASARTFLFEKIADLQFPYISKDQSPENDLVRRWLGFSVVENHKRSTTEPAVQYLLRHTRLLPRDIVLMGNAICSSIKRRNAEKRPFSERKLRQIVHEVGRYIANEAIKSCAQEYLSSIDYVAEILLSNRKRNEILSSSDESDIDQKNIEDVIDQIRFHVVERIGRMIEHIGVENFDRKTLKSALILFDLAVDEQFSTNGREAFYRFDNILYRHGLLAYQGLENSVFKWKFSWRDIPTMDNSQLPGSETYYGFHSSLIDAFPNIMIDKRGPVM